MLFEGASVLGSSFRMRGKYTGIDPDRGWGKGEVRISTNALPRSYSCVSKELAVDSSLQRKVLSDA